MSIGGICSPYSRHKQREKKTGQDASSSRNLSQGHVSIYLNSHPKTSFLFKEYLHLLTENSIHSCIHTIYPFHILPQRPSNTFMSSLELVHLVLSACTWAWCHLLEHGQLTTSYTPEEQTSLPLPAAITCWLLLN